MTTITDTYQAQQQKLQQAASGAQITNLSITGSWPPIFNPADDYQREMILEVSVTNTPDELYQAYGAAPGTSQLQEVQGDLTVTLNLNPA